MTEDERYVREHWTGGAQAWNDVALAPDCWKVQVGAFSSATVLACVQGTEEQAWAAAAKATHERWWDIKFAADEEKWLRYQCAGPTPWAEGCRQRLMADRAARLVELRKGWRNG